MKTRNVKMNKSDIEYFDSLVDDRTIKDRVQAISFVVDKVKSMGDNP